MLQGFDLAHDSKSIFLENHREGSPSQKGTRHVQALFLRTPPRYNNSIMELKVTLPEDVAKTAGLAGLDTSDQARFPLLLELYREGRLSLGRFAELASFSQAELLEKMSEHGTYLNYSLEDLEDDRKVLP